MIKLNKRYFIIFIIFFIVEVLIAVYVHDGIIRPFVGDILVVILIYCFVKAFVSVRTKLLPLYIFLFASTVELLQYFQIVKHLNLQNNRVLRIAIGSTFDKKDILCYLLGSCILFIYERIQINQRGK
ncbi:DUF2809 domain-containing protein [Clostridiaceae bacterium M8S5]|nr:DUF2809 domain-containing protein [Clostridiaceae bacterium M8S5]